MNNDKDKWEERAKHWDNKLPALAAALRSDNVQAICADIEKYGWIRCVTDNPANHDAVQVTDGKNTWIGFYHPVGKKWTVIMDAPFDAKDVIAWTYMLSVPDDLND